jgi:myo-inositol 2-dehydrogenase/D-chiro-inositol 1-dehydrogenase
LNNVNIGMIGAGRIGKIHAENLYALPQVTVKAVSDLFPEKVRDWATGLGIQQVASDYKTIIDDPEIDALFICSSTHTHTEIIEQAAAAGKHVFCEKPISFALEDTQRAIAQAERAGITFQTGFNRRFDPNFARVRSLVAEGAVGEPHLIKITSRDPAPPPYEYIQVSGGLFLDMAIHDFDMARYLSGSEVVEVFAAGGVLVDPEIGKLNDIDTAITTLRFANGALGVIDNSRQAAYGYDQRAEVFGSKGNVNVQNVFPTSAEVSTAGGIYKDKPLYFFLERYKESYRLEVEQFIHCIRRGEPAAVSGRDGLQAERIAYAAKLSQQERRPVKLEEIE